MAPTIRPQSCKFYKTPPILCKRNRPFTNIVFREIPMAKPDPAALAAQVQGRKLPPVERWNPPLSGEMDLRIARDGTWYHEGRPIAREALVRVFSTLLRRDPDGHHYLLTPAEKWRIQVEDAPFLAVLLEADGAGRAQRLHFTTNLGDRVCAGPDHPIEVVFAADGEPSPYVRVRGRLQALISRAVYLELVELGVEHGGGRREYGVWSDGAFFSLGRLDEEASP